MKLLHLIGWTLIVEPHSRPMPRLWPWVLLGFLSGTAIFFLGLEY